MSTLALVVSTDPGVLQRYQSALADQFDRLYAVPNFGEARQLLMTGSFDVLLSDVQLDAFNGLQLALWCSLRMLATRVVMVGPRDPVLEADAVLAGAWYLTAPDREALQGVVSQALMRVDQPTRRLPRKRVAIDLRVLVGDAQARLVNVSYGGFCIDVPGDGQPSRSNPFSLDIPQFQIHAPARCVWATPLGSHRRCGAALETGDEFTDAGWRTLVDLIGSAANVPPSL